jgi:hypothetical protein
VPRCPYRKPEAGDGAPDGILSSGSEITTAVNIAMLQNRIRNSVAAVFVFFDGS